MKSIKLLLVSIAIILGLMSCDKLKEPYIIESIVTKSDTIALEQADYDNFDGKVVVLLEDYTGVRCNNCPDAALIANQLQEDNEGHLIVLGVHPDGGQQSPTGGYPEFRTADATEWNNHYNITGYPNGMVNRNGVLNPAQWTTAVENIIGSDAPVMLVVKSEYDDATRELKLSIHSIFRQDVESSDVRLTVCMMEDSIVGAQATSHGVNPSYMHRHVFRGTADGMTWGKTMSDTESISAGSYFVSNMKFTLSEDYNEDEFYIVAFISDYNSANREVLMAAETKIK